jgi:hypothetical protein
MSPGANGIDAEDIFASKFFSIPIIVLSPDSSTRMVTCGEGVSKVSIHSVERPLSEIAFFRFNPSESFPTYPTRLTGRFALQMPEATLNPCPQGLS